MSGNKSLTEKADKPENVFQSHQVICSSRTKIWVRFLEQKVQMGTQTKEASVTEPLKNN